MPFDEQGLKILLNEHFDKVENSFISGESPRILPYLQEDFDIIFLSSTQAYREVLLGCLLVRITDKTKDVHLPYVRMGVSAFSGRSLDERIVNPFLREKRIPLSRGPYLSVFRRQVRFDTATREGLRDQRGFDSFLRILDFIAHEEDHERLLSLLDYLLYRFILLREAARVSLTKLDRISLSQYKRLIGGLITRPSGGVFPFILVLSMLETVTICFSIDWRVEFQEINVADRASGVGGDIVLKDRGEERDVLTIEVTERVVDAHRIIATFTEKIAPLNITDYVFAVRLNQIDERANKQAERYFPQGYEINFVDIEGWLINILTLIGVKGRMVFQERVIEHLSRDQIPKALKIAWNEEIARLIG